MAIPHGDPLEALIGSAPGISAATDLETLRNEWERWFSTWAWCLRELDEQVSARGSQRDPVSLTLRPRGVS